MTKTLDRPIILLCSERSGSNLITRMFDAHPQVTGPGAAHLWRVMCPLAPRYEQHPAALRADMMALFDAKLLTWQIDRWSADARSALLEDTADAAEMGARLYEAERREAAKNFVFIKENQAFLLIDAILRVAHAPRFIHMVRDPRDMALSWAQAPALRGGVLRAARQWRADQTGFGTVMTSNSSVSVRYEDLVAAPHATLSKICAAIDLPFHEHMLAPATYSARAAADAGRATMLTNLAKPILADNVAKYRDGLSAAQCAYVEAECACLMDEFGYLPAQPPAALTTLEAAMAAAEPWEKPGYAHLPVAERARFAAWFALVARLRA